MKKHRLYVYSIVLSVFLGIAMLCPLSSAYAETSFPSKYSSVEKGWVNDPRDQGDSGTCWAFSTAAAIETNAIKNGILKKGDSISPLQLIYAASHGVEDPLHNLVIPKAAKNNDSLDYLKIGGNSLDVMTASSTHGIFQSEINSPYELRFENKAISTNPSDDMVWLREGKLTLFPTEQQVKQAVLEYGSTSGVFDSPTAVSGTFDYANSASYIPRWSFMGTAHEMQIVGWDDDFPASNFRSNAHEIKDVNITYDSINLFDSDLLNTRELSDFPEPKVLNAITNEVNESTISINFTSDPNDDSALTKVLSGASSVL